MGIGSKRVDWEESRPVAKREKEGQGDEQGAKREMVGVAEAEAVATTERLDQV